MKGTCLFVFLIISTISLAQKSNHRLWDSFLKTYVSDEGNVNYKQIIKSPEDLKVYLNNLVGSQPNLNWTKNEQLAYWINAYNAYTIKLIIDNYPINSIKDIRNPWDEKFIPFDGQLISLNFIEHEILRKMDEPRIHFAIVCASVSCPKLQNDAFVPNQLEKQLTVATKSFLADTDRNDITKNELRISQIFKWFTKDFKQNGSLIEFLNKYTDKEISESAKLTYLDYNWALND